MRRMHDFLYVIDYSNPVHLVSLEVAEIRLLYIFVVQPQL